jgi:hypothetical protein
VLTIANRSLKQRLAKMGNRAGGNLNILVNAEGFC